MRELAPRQRIRKMTIDDLPEVMEIERVAFSNPWTQEMVKKELTQDWSTILLAEEPSPTRRGWRIVGMSIFWLVHDEIHVLNVAVHPDFRKRGIGRLLMEATLEHGRLHRCRNASLEVRRGNEAALALYRAMGFKPVGMRPNYYQDDREDAVIMLVDL